MPRLVIGCGLGHPAHNHAADVTIDTSAAVVGSITDPASGPLANALWRRFFTIIYFENVPAGIFNTLRDCRTVVAHLALLLAPNGVVRIRSGAWARQYLPDVRQAFRHFGFVVEHDLMFSDAQGVHVAVTPLMNRLGLDQGSDAADAQAVDFVVRRGAGPAQVSLESPI